MDAQDDLVAGLSVDPHADFVGLSVEQVMRGEPVQSVGSTMND